MTQNASNLIATIPFQANKPTLLPMNELFNWVIWQFPLPKEGGLCGAVHPPLPDHTWYPAIIRNGGQQVQVYAHLEANFASPEEAMNYLCQNKTS